MEKVQSLVISDIFLEGFFLVESVDFGLISFDFGSGNSLARNKTLVNVISDFGVSGLKVLTSLRGLEAKTMNSTSDIILSLNTVIMSSTTVQITLLSNFKLGDLKEVYLNIIIFNEAEIEKNKYSFIDSDSLSITHSNYAND